MEICIRGQNKALLDAGSRRILVAWKPAATCGVNAAGTFEGLKHCIARRGMSDTARGSLSLFSGAFPLVDADLNILLPKTSLAYLSTMSVFKIPGPLPKVDLTLKLFNAGIAELRPACLIGTSNVLPANVCSSSVTLELTAFTCL